MTFTPHIYDGVATWREQGLGPHSLAEGEDDSWAFALKGARTWRIFIKGPFDPLEVTLYAKEVVDREAAFKDLAALLDVIPDLDAQARAIPSRFDHAEELALVNAYDRWICLAYFATTVNTQWEVLFEVTADGGWVCHGIMNSELRARFFAQG